MKKYLKLFCSLKKMLYICCYKSVKLKNMKKEQFLKLEVVSNLSVTYKGTKHWVVGKDLDEGLICIVEDDNGSCEMWKKKMVRFENCTL